MPMLDQKAITVIFANIEDLLLTNTVRYPAWLIEIVNSIQYPAAVDLSKFSRRTSERVPIVRR